MLQIAANRVDAPQSDAKRQQTTQNVTKREESDRRQKVRFPSGTELAVLLSSLSRPSSLFPSLSQGLVLSSSPGPLPARGPGTRSVFPLARARWGQLDAPARPSAVVDTRQHVQADDLARAGACTCKVLGKREMRISGARPLSLFSPREWRPVTSPGSAPRARAAAEDVRNAHAPRLPVRRHLPTVGGSTDGRKKKSRPAPTL